jgi:hypothetical protein
MGLLDWFRRNGAAPSRAARDWHAAWETALEALDGEAPARLDAWLRRDPAFAADAEVEEEMLDALREALALDRDLAAARLPVIETSHRAAAGETCHYSAPVSMPDDPAQPTGRLLLTAGRAAFAGGNRTPSVPWHAARGVLRAGRDLVIVRAGAADGVRFRCNTYVDAVRGAAIARHLARAARKPL